MTKIIKFDQAFPSKKQEQFILLCYWFISNKNNEFIFKTLDQIALSVGKKSLKIVCLNPFNQIKDIKEYRTQNKISHDLRCDTKRTGLFYQVSTFPTFILMRPNGKIIHRKSGIDLACIFEIENKIKQAHNEFNIELNKDISLNSIDYKKNLSYSGI